MMGLLQQRVEDSVIWTRGGNLAARSIDQDRDKRRASASKAYVTQPCFLPLFETVHHYLLSIWQTNGRENIYLSVLL